MLHLKLTDPIKYSWAIPVSGDFHYQFHFASCIHRLAYLPFLKWFVDATGMHKTIPKAMDDTKHIKYIDHFYQLVIKSVLTYLTDVYGHEYMSKKPSEILEEQKLNNGAPAERRVVWGRAPSPRDPRAPSPRDPRRLELFGPRSS